MLLMMSISACDHHRNGQRPSLLDLVFTFNSDSIQSIQHHSPLGSSDHDCLTWQYDCLFEKTIVEGSSYNYWKGNYHGSAYSTVRYYLSPLNTLDNANKDLLKENKLHFIAVSIYYCVLHV